MSWDPGERPTFPEAGFEEERVLEEIKTKVTDEATLAEALDAYVKLEGLLARLASRANRAEDLAKRRRLDRKWRKWLGRGGRMPVPPGEIARVAGHVEEFMGQLRERFPGLMDEYRKRELGL